MGWLLAGLVEGSVGCESKEHPFRRTGAPNCQEHIRGLGSASARAVRLTISDSALTAARGRRRPQLATGEDYLTLTLWLATPPNTPAVMKFIHAMCLYISGRWRRAMCWIRSDVPTNPDLIASDATPN